MEEKNVQPTQEWIDAKKKEYGKIYTVKISGQTYIYRYLKRSEFKEIQKGITPEMTPQGPIVPNDQALEVEEKVTKLCILWPEDYIAKIESGDIPATAPSVLATYISDSSGASVEEYPQEL